MAKKLLTTQELAEELGGITTVRVWQIAKSRGIEPAEAGGNGTPAMWPRKAIKDLERRPRGRPKLIPDGVSK